MKTDAERDAIKAEVAELRKQLAEVERERDESNEALCSEVAKIVDERNFLKAEVADLRKQLAEVERERDIEKETCADWHNEAIALKAEVAELKRLHNGPIVGIGGHERGE